MEVELNETQIKNTLYFLGDIDLRGKATEVIAEMVSLRTTYERMLKQPSASLPPPAPIKPNRS